MNVTAPSSAPDGIEHRRTTAISERERRKDARRKILVGATVLTRAEKDPGSHDRLTMLDAALTRDDDRALFDLSPLDDAAWAGHGTGITDTEKVVAT